MNIPSLMPNGAFNPIELDQYLDDCITNKVPNRKIASALGVPIDRFIYATGIGRENFRQRAIRHSALEQILCQ